METPPAPAPGAADPPASPPPADPGAAASWVPAPPTPVEPSVPSPVDELRRRSIRGRMRNLGIIMVVLALVTVGFMAYNVATYEQETLANGPFREGGSLEVHVVPPAEGWEVKLFALDGEKREFARLGTDANGTADFGSVQDEVFRLEATRDNTTVAGNVHAPKNAATVVTLDSNGPAHEWLGEKPAIKAVDWVIIGLFTALVALAVAGGVSLARARNPRLASGGAGAAAAIGLLTGGIALSPIGVGLLVVGIWSLFTVRRNPDLFAK